MSQSSTDNIASHIVEVEELYRKSDLAATLHTKQMSLICSTFSLELRAAIYEAWGLLKIVSNDSLRKKFVNELTDKLESHIFEEDK